MAVRVRNQWRRFWSRQRRAFARAACVFGLSTLLLLPCATAFAAKVASVTVSGLTTYEVNKVLEVIPIKAGDDFSLREVDAAIAHLRKWGVFDEINVSPTKTADGVILDFKLSEAKIVASIDVDGNYPYIEYKVRKFLTLHPGDIYTPERLDEQITRIKEFYEREGYRNTDVTVEEEPTPDDNTVVITFHIHRGDLLRIRDVTVDGNHALLKGRFVTALNPIKPFSERRLREAIREIKEAYQAKGYPKARIKLAQKLIDFNRNRIDLFFEVNEGPHVVITFTGIEHISKRDLMRAITIMREGSTDEFEIEASIEALSKYFVARGYPEASITSQSDVQDDGTVVITFNIDRGKEQRIRFLSFEGNRDVDDKKLSFAMKNTQMGFGKRGAYLPDDVAADNTAISKALAKEGYLRPEIGNWDVEPTKQGYALAITIPVHEGIQTLVDDIELVGAPEGLKRRRLIKQLVSRPGKPLNQPELEADRGRVLSYLADHGYPYAQVGQSWREDESGAHAIVRYEIDSGPLVHIGKILFVGDVLSSQKALRRAMEIEEGDPFSYRKILDSQLAIRRLGAFTYVSIETIGIDEHRDVVHLKVKVEEERPYLIDVGASYSTDESFTGSLTFSNINAFGWAKTNTLKLTGGRDLSRAEVSWLDPRFLGSSIEMSVAAWVQYKRKPSYTYMQTAGGFGWSKRLSRFGFYFKYEIDKNYFIEGDTTAANADSLNNDTISRISMSSSYDSRDNFANPTKGFYTIGAIDIFDEIHGNNSNFVRFNWQGEYDFGFLNRFVFSTAMRFGRIQTIGDNVVIPINELYFLGGDTTIRGFSEDSLGPLDANGNATGATTRWIVNEELRVKLFRSISAVAFFDIGSLTNAFSQINGDTIRKSIGIGIRYLTPVGPVRAEYGFKLKPRSGESVGRFHFTFGYVF